MREIKFRAKILGHIGYVYGTPFNQHFDKEFANKWFDSMHGFDENGEVIDEYIEQETLSQFTGLYDQNGKEIYEGDIIKGTFTDSMIVVYENGSFCFKNNDNSGVDRLHQMRVSKLKVIGNIHENQNLINNK